MKKSTKIIAALVLVAGIMSSCITATVLRAKWAVEEEEEIVSGKVFTLEKGTFFYRYQGLTQGMALAFKDYGKYLRVDNYYAKTFIIITPDKVYKGYTDDKTYVEKENTNGAYYYSDLSMVFPIEWFRFEKFADDMVDSENTNKKEGFIYFNPSEGGDIKNFKCITFTDDGYEVAGYERIFISKKENNKLVFECNRTRKDCALELSVPSDYKKKSGTIDYEEDF